MTSDEKKLTLRPNPHTLGVTPLAEGEVTFMCRIRMDESPKAEQWRKMTARERGQTLMKMLSGMTDKEIEALAEKYESEGA